MATDAVSFVQCPSLLEFGSRRGDRQRRLWGCRMAEWWHAQRRLSVERERDNSPEPWFDRPQSGRVNEPRGAAPSNHQREVLDAVDEVRDRWRHDSGASVELPQLRPVGCSICGEHTVATSLKHEVAGRGQHPAVFDNGQIDGPCGPTLYGIPRDEASSRWRSRNQLLNQRALIGGLHACIEVSDTWLPFGIGRWNERCAVLHRDVHESRPRMKGHRIPIVRTIRTRRNQYRRHSSVRLRRYDRPPRLWIDAGRPCHLCVRSRGDELPCGAVEDVEERIL